MTVVTLLIRSDLSLDLSSVISKDSVHLAFASLDVAELINRERKISVINLK